MLEVAYWNELLCPVSFSGVCQEQFKLPGT